jgi:spore coat polysaccharide biosynthesis protein SpsF
MKDVYAIIQARMAASRLPGKVLLEIAGKPMLAWVVERTARAQTLSGVLVATTRDPSDDTVDSFCRAKGYWVERGSDHDVLDRYYQAAKQARADVIVRVTADCPFIDPGLIDEAVKLMLGESTHSSKQRKAAQGFDFVANRLPPPWGRTYPIGLDVEVFGFDLLGRAWREAVPRHQREHVAPYFYEDAPVDPLVYGNRELPYTATTTPKG